MQALLVFFVVTLVYTSFAQNCDGTKFNESSLECYLYRDLSSISAGISNDWAEASVDRCFTYIAALPDSDWVIRENYFLPKNNNVTIENIFYNEDCIEECRRVSWCQSADFSVGYDKCHLQDQYGRDNIEPHLMNFVNYLEKPQCYSTDVLGPGSFDYFRLGLRLLVNDYFTEAINAFTKAVELSPYSSMMYWGKSLALLVNSNNAEARAVMDEYNTRDTSGLIYITPSQSELPYMTALQNALAGSDNISRALGDNFKAIFDSSPTESRDVTAAYLAIVVYSRGGYISQIPAILQDILQFDASDRLAQLISLQILASSRNAVKQITADERNTVLGAINSITTASNGDPRSWIAAVRANFVLDRYQETIDPAKTARTVIAAAYRAGIADGTYIVELLHSYKIQHASLVYMYEINGAAQVINDIENVRNQLPADSPNKVLYQVLYYDLLYSQYFAYWFTEADKASLPAGSPDDVAAIPNSTPSQRLTQLNLMIAIVMKNLDPEAQRDPSYFTSVRDKLSNFIQANDGSEIAKVAIINKNILMTVNALFNSNNWFTTRERVVEDGGYMDEAIELYNALSEREMSLVIMSPYEVTQYAIKVLSRNIPGPLPLVGALGIPDLSSLKTALSDPLINTPSIQMSLAQVLFAMGRLDDAEATLLALEASLDVQTPSWLQSALQAVRATSISSSALGAGPIVEFGGPELFDEDTKDLYDNLEKDWSWQIEATLYGRCTAYYMDNDLTWPVINEVSILSTQLKYYESATVEICRLRCLYETEFNCRAFTYGYGRCLLHDQSYDQVSAANKLSNLRDEQFYSLPSCPSASSDSHSLVQLGAKAIANGLSELAMTSFDKVLDEYQTNAPIALIMKAMLLKNDPCSQDAVNILPSANTQMTDHEAKWRAVVAMMINNNANGVGNALQSLLSDYPADSLAIGLRNELDSTENLGNNPSFSWDKITKLNRLLNAEPIEWSVINNLITSLEMKSPSSPLPRYFIAWKAVKLGEWATAKAASNSVVSSEIANIRGYDDSSRPKSITNMIRQIYNFALIQRMELQAARSTLITPDENLDVGLRFLLFSQFTVVNRINQGELDAVEALYIDTTACRSILGSRLIAAAMNAVQAYEVSDPAIISARRSAMENLISQGSEFTPWRKLADVFSALRDVPPRFSEESLNDIPDNTPVFSPVAFPRASYNSEIALARPKLGIPLVDKSELYVWAMVESQGLDTNEKINTNLARVNDVLQRWPNRAVSLWLKFKVEQAAVFLMENKRTENATRAAQDALIVWNDRDDNLPVAQALLDYINSPGTRTTTTNAPTPDSSQANEMMPWWVIIVIVVTASVVLALIIILIAVQCACRKRQKSQKPYSGSIHSVSQSESGHNVRAAQSDIFYTAPDTGGMVETTEDFSN